MVRFESCLSFKYFISQGFKCPKKYNPADYIIKTLSIAPSNRNESQERINVNSY